MLFLANSLRRRCARPDNGCAHRAPCRRYAPFTGRRTTFRVLNKKHALKLQTLGRSAGGGPRFRPAAGEAFLLWHYALVAHGAALAREFPENRVYFLSSNMLNWQVTLGMMIIDIFGLKDLVDHST